MEGPQGSPLSLCCLWGRIHAKTILQKPTGVSNDRVRPLDDCVVTACAKDWPEATNASAGDDVVYFISFKPPFPWQKRYTTFLRLSASCILLSLFHQGLSGNQ